MMGRGRFGREDGEMTVHTRENTRMVKMVVTSRETVNMMKVASWKEMLTMVTVLVITRRKETMITRLMKK